MPEVNTLCLRFSGNKAELKNQLQDWCEKSNKTMNGTIVELIEQLLETKNFKSN